MFPRPQLTRAGTASIVHTDTIILLLTAVIRMAATLTIVTDIVTAIEATTGVTITVPGTIVQRKCPDG